MSENIEVQDQVEAQEQEQAQVEASNAADAIDEAPEQEAVEASSPKKASKKASKAAPKGKKGAKGAKASTAGATATTTRKPPVPLNKKADGAATPAKAPKAKAAPKASANGKTSCIDVAAKILKGRKGPMSCKELIDKMTADGSWTSPRGKTPAATLYSSIIREISTKGKESRFVKTDKGRFAAAK